MDLRSYTKQELALLYFPDSDPDVARAHLMRWIVRCTQLYEQLLKSGYNKSCKEFNPLQGKHPTPIAIQLHPQCLLGIQSILRNWTFLIFKQV